MAEDRVPKWVYIHERRYDVVDSKAETLVFRRPYCDNELYTAKEQKDRKLGLYYVYDINHQKVGEIDTEKAFSSGAVANFYW